MIGRAVRRALPALLLAGCATPPPYDYTALIEHMPRSILVLPPLDETLEPAACYGSLAVVTSPLAERGYYVFPVAVVDAMMRENGLPTPAEMHAVPLEKLREVFDADAVLYLTVTDWGTGYHVVSSDTQVTLQGRLVDTRTGVELWRGERSAVRGSGSGGGIVEMLAGALVNQVATSISDPSEELAREAAQGLFTEPHTGLLLGPRHPDHERSVAEARSRR